jgi:hypothetical protein
MLVPDFAGEALVPPSIAVPLGAGLNGKSWVLSSNRKKRANVRNDCLQRLNKSKALWNLLSEILLEGIDNIFIPNRNSRDNASATKFSLPGNHFEQ